MFLVVSSQIDSEFLSLAHALQLLMLLAHLFLLVLAGTVPSVSIASVM
jgi:hypothetical protein